MRVLTTAALAVALVVVPVGTAHADPTTEPVDPSTAVSFPVLPFGARVLTIEFPQASVDGSVTEDGKVITLRADVFFAYNKATLNSKASAALDRAAARLKELGATTVRVAGYTDSKGAAAYNRGLSLRRAEAVRAGLATRLPDLTQAVKGYGESRPVASNETAKGRALNRRVTIAVTR